MKLFKDLHCPDVVVMFPDGRVTRGIEEHIADMNNVLFNGTPDSRITSHPIAFGSGEWTVAAGVLEATLRSRSNEPNAGGARTSPDRGDCILAYALPKRQ